MYPTTVFRRFAGWCVGLVKKFFSSGHKQGNRKELRYKSAADIVSLRLKAINADIKRRRDTITRYNTILTPAEIRDIEAEIRILLEEKHDILDARRARRYSYERRTG